MCNQLWNEHNRCNELLHFFWVFLQEKSNLISWKVKLFSKRPLLEIPDIVSMENPDLLLQAKSHQSSNAFLKGFNLEISYSNVREKPANSG